MFNLFGDSKPTKRPRRTTDRRAGPRQGPYVGKQPRTRNKDGRWRRKSALAGKPHETRKKGLFF